MSLIKVWYFAAYKVTARNGLTFDGERTFRTIPVANGFSLGAFAPADMNLKRQSDDLHAPSLFRLCLITLMSTATPRNSQSKR